jgi:hypothetical protein
MCHYPDVADEWFVIEQPDPRFKGEARHLFGPFYRARVLDTATGGYLPLFRGGSLLTGRASARRAVKYGIERYRRQHP